MRAFELRRISPLRCANVLAVVLAVFYGVLAIVMAPLASLVLPLANLSGARSPSAQSGVPALPPSWLPLMFILFYPLFGGVFGWIFGGLGALVYNFTVRFTGGVAMELDEAALDVQP